MGSIWPNELPSQDQSHCELFICSEENNRNQMWQSIFKRSHLTVFFSVHNLVRMSIRITALPDGVSWWLVPDEPEVAKRCLCLHAVMLCSRLEELCAENILDVLCLASQSYLAYVAILVARGGLYLLQHSTQSLMDYTGTLRCQMRLYRPGFSQTCSQKEKGHSDLHLILYPNPRLRLSGKCKKTAMKKIKKGTKITNRYLLQSPCWSGPRCGWQTDSSAGGPSSLMLLRQKAFHPDAAGLDWFPNPILVTAP